MFRTLIGRLNPMLDEFEAGGGGAGAEVQDFADPADETSEGAEVSDLADPIDETSDDDAGKTDADAAFAQMRRDLEEAQRQRAEAQRLAEEAELSRDQYRDALGLFFDGDDTVAQAHAQATGRSIEEVKAELEAQEHYRTLESENQALNAKIRDYEAEKRMAKDLAEIQAIDPSVKSLEDLGQTYLDYISQGLSGKQAYFAAKAQDAIEKAVPPDEIGRVNQSSEEKTYFTHDEVAAMTPEEVKANFDKIMASQSRW